MISVIIPTCNRNELLGICLDKLSPNVQLLSEDVYEVIVTDDSANNSAFDFIQKNYSWVQYVAGPKKGPAANRNNGAKYAKGDWLVFVDDDCEPDSRLISLYLHSIHSNKETLAFEGAIFPDNWQLLKKDLSECPINTSGGCFWSANICINTELFKSIGGFNELYKIAAQEDQQMKIDIEKKGSKILFIHECFVIHPVRFTSIVKQLKKIPIASKNFSIYAFKNSSTLHYTTLTDFAIKQLYFVLRNTKASIKKGKIKNTIISLAWLFYGMPLNIFNYYKLGLKNQDSR